MLFKEMSNRFATLSRGHPDGIGLLETLLDLKRLHCNIISSLAVLTWVALQLDHGSAQVRKDRSEHVPGKKKDRSEHVSVSGFDDRSSTLECSS